MHEKYATLRNTKGFKKELERSNFPEIMEVTSPQNFKAFRPKGSCAIVNDSMTPGLKENLLIKKVKILP